MTRLHAMTPVTPAALALAIGAALAFAQATPPANQYPEWDQLTPAQRDALVAPLRERWKHYQSLGLDLAKHDM